MIGGAIQDEDTIEDADDNTSPQIVEILEEDFHRSTINTQDVVEELAQDALPDTQKLADKPQTGKGKKKTRSMGDLGLSSQLVISPLLVGGRGVLWGGKNFI